MISAMNLGRFLADTARVMPDRIGLVHGDESWTWAELNANSNAFRDALKALGVKKGDRVVVQSRNNRAMFESLWGIFKVGAVWVPSNFRQTPSEIAYVAENSGATAFLFESIFAEHAAAAQAGSDDLKVLIAIGGAEGAEDYEGLLEKHGGAGDGEEPVEYHDPCWLFYTSGTTGRPKGAALTHGQMAFVTNNFMADLMPDLTADDASLVVAPLSHGAGCHAFPQVVRGAKTVLMPGEGMDPETVWRLVEEHKVSNAFTVPTIVKMLVEHPSVDKYDHSSLRHVIHAGAPMYQEDQRYAYKKLGPVLVEYYGQGEVTGCITVLRPEHYVIEDDDPRGPVRPGTCGLPRVGVEIGIRSPEGEMLSAGEQGEICVKGPSVMEGYWKNDKANAEVFQDGWFLTGDLGRVDEAGFVYITGRAKDMYISGGSNVYPREIEEVMLTHPGVSEVAVLGIPHTKWGEVGIAVIVPTEEGSASEDLDADLGGFINAELSRYKHPKKIIYWDELPKSGYGKVPKHLIRNTLYEKGDLVEGQDL
jgi:fatty-acyl-CoA synthase